MENALSLAEFDEIVLAHADEDIDDVLEHYGRLGMKWYQHIYGEEDGRARYNDKWKAKESSKVRKRANKQYVGAGKSAHRLFENEKPYMARQLLKARNLSADLAIKELTRIANMSTEDILKETKEKLVISRQNLVQGKHKTRLFLENRDVKNILRSTIMHFLRNLISKIQ